MKKFMNRLSSLFKDVEFELAGKKIRILALAVTAVIFIFVALHSKLYLDPELDVAYGGILLAISLICAPICGLLIAVRLKVPEKLSRILTTIVFFLMPVITLRQTDAALSWRPPTASALPATPSPPSSSRWPGASCCPNRPMSGSWPSAPACKIKV